LVAAVRTDGCDAEFGGGAVAGGDYARRTGTRADWGTLVGRGVLRGIPVDPTGTPYELTQDGAVELSRLPTKFRRTLAGSPSNSAALRCQVLVATQSAPRHGIGGGSYRVMILRSVIADTALPARSQPRAGVVAGG
jgi:hypothetical protein